MAEVRKGCNVGSSLVTASASTSREASQLAAKDVLQSDIPWRLMPIALSPKKILHWDEALQMKARLYAAFGPSTSDLDDDSDIEPAKGAKSGDNRHEKGSKKKGGRSTKSTKV